MELGLSRRAAGGDEPPAHRARNRAPARENDMKRLTILIAKLCLKSELQHRVMRSVLMTVMVVSTAAPSVVEVKECTVTWSQDHKKESCSTVRPTRQEYTRTH